MTDNSVVRGFDEVAQEYDSQRKHLIPCFQDFYSHAVWAIPESFIKPNILDLGAGTGLLSAYVLARFPSAAITLMDLSEPMLKQAHKRFSGESNISFIAGDYIHGDIPGQYDIVISALSIHHLSEHEKRLVFQRAHSLLKPNGVFINADQALGEHAHMEERYAMEWNRFIESGPLSPIEIQRAHARMSQDRTSRASDQITWLMEAGFANVECVYRYRNFTVLYAERSKP